MQEDNLRETKTLSNYIIKNESKVEKKNNSLNASKVTVHPTFNDGYIVRGRKTEEGKESHRFLV